MAYSCNPLQGNPTVAKYQPEILTDFRTQFHDDEVEMGYFQQGRATRYSARITVAMLREFFNNPIRSRNRESIWPPRSCDLTPPHYFCGPIYQRTLFVERLLTI